ncbi:MAG: hypothetical protein ACLP7Q_07175 [Isosphaeraceae bacterium]
MSPDSAVTKDRLYRTLDRLLAAQSTIEQDLKDRLGTLFQLDYDLLLCDLTSTYFEGLAADNELACRGYSRDHRSDCRKLALCRVARPGPEQAKTLTVLKIILPERLTPDREM